MYAWLVFGHSMKPSTKNSNTNHASQWMEKKGGGGHYNGGMEHSFEDKLPFQKQSKVFNV